MAYTPAHMSKDDAKIKAVIEGKAADYFTKLEAILAKSKFICGDKLTVIDFWAGSFYFDRCINQGNPNKTTLACWAELLKKYPNFKRFGEDFRKENCDWLEKRKTYEF